MVSEVLGSVVSEVIAAGIVAAIGVLVYRWVDSHRFRNRTDNRQIVFSGTHLEGNLLCMRRLAEVRTVDELFQRERHLCGHFVKAVKATSSADPVVRLPAGIVEQEVMSLIRSHLATQFAKELMWQTCGMDDSRRNVQVHVVPTFEHYESDPFRRIRVMVVLPALLESLPPGDSVVCRAGKHHHINRLTTLRSVKAFLDALPTVRRAEYIIPVPPPAISRS